MLTQPRSGTVRALSILEAIAGKNIFWHDSAEKITLENGNLHPRFRRASPLKKMNKLDRSFTKVEYLDKKNVIYGSHFHTCFKGWNQNNNKLIFLSRNPKEIFFRELLNKNVPISVESIKNFLPRIFPSYINRFKVYDLWPKKNRLLIFYDDTIGNSNLFLQLEKLLNFVGVSFSFEKENYDQFFEKILTFYKKEQKYAYGGLSTSKSGPKKIYYTKNIDRELLKMIDNYLKVQNPEIWNKYLKRFETK